mgnify:CR=1 FL=1
MDYAVGDLLTENDEHYHPRVPSSWRDYGMGIIIHIDTQKEIATIYWFEVGISSLYKFRNMRKYLVTVSQPRT